MLNCGFACSMAMWLPSSKHPKYPTICISLKALPKDERSGLPAMISKVALGLISYTSYIYRIQSKRFKIETEKMSCYMLHHKILQTYNSDKEAVARFPVISHCFEASSFSDQWSRTRYTSWNFPTGHLRLLHRTLELLVLNITIQKTELKPWSVGLTDWQPRLFSFLLSNVGKKTHWIPNHGSNIRNFHDLQVTTPRGRTTTLSWTSSEKPQTTTNPISCIWGLALVHNIHDNLLSLSPTMASQNGRCHIGIFK